METLPFESQMNITAMTLSPSGNILIAVNEGKMMLMWFIAVEGRSSFQSMYMYVRDFH